MKRIPLFIFIFLATSNLFAQDVEKLDNDLKINIDDLVIPDGYLLDMRSILPAPPTLAVPAFDWREMKKDNRFDETFFYRKNVKYGRSEYYSLSDNFSPFGFGNSTTLNKATYSLRNGMKINTYGEYDADGYKRNNPSALPWQKNNFKGAFEMKTKNGNFGVRVEVQRGRDNPF